MGSRSESKPPSAHVSGANPSFGDPPHDATLPRQQTDTHPNETTLPRQQTDDPLERALALAYRHLNRRDRTVVEMRRHLGRQALAADVVETAIAILTDQGYVDDARFARLFVEDKRELEQWGNDRIERALVDRGIDRELVARTLGETAQPPELDRALELLRRRFPSPALDRRERDRALGFLVRKGYDSEIAVDALAAHARSA